MTQRTSRMAARLACLICAGIVACNADAGRGGTAPTATGTTSAGTGTGGGTGTGSTTGGSTTTTGAANPALDVLPPASTGIDPASTLPTSTAATQMSGPVQVRAIGRVDDSNVTAPMKLADGTSAAGLQLAWPASGVAMSFRGTQLAVTMANIVNFATGVYSYYDLVVDGNPPVVLKVQGGSAVYPISDRLAPGIHTVVLTKRSEEQFGVDLFENFLIDATGTFMPPPAGSGRRMEFIGDSLTAGFGDLATDPNSAACSPNGPNTATSTTEDASLSYAALTAAAVGADYTNIAFSGKGLIRNRDPVGDPTRTMPVLWQDVLPVNSSSIVTERPWDFTRYTPQAVVINLGTNDLLAPTSSGVPALTAAQLTAGYVAFIAQVRAKYPGVTIFTVVGPELSGSSLAEAEAAIHNSAVQSDGNIVYVEFAEDTGQNADGTVNWGCNYHPARSTQASMAATLIAQVKKTMGW